MGNDIDVLMLTKYDWANTGWRFQKCLELLGLKVRFIKGKRHDFNYGEEADIHQALTKKEESKYPITVDAPELRYLAGQAHVIYFMHTTFVKTGIDLRQKFVVVDHGGITYRNESDICNMVFNPIADATIGHCPDMLFHGAHNEHLIYYPVDTEKFQPDYTKKGEKLIIGHFPSNPENKGTDIFLRAINILEQDRSFMDKFQYIGVKNDKWATNTKREWSENIKLIRSCDVLMETCKLSLPDLNNNRTVPFGEWGNTAIESSSCGVPVITNSLSTDYYQQEYGDLGLHIANDLQQVVMQLKKFIRMEDDELARAKKTARAWVVKHHSMQATADRMWNKVFSNFFEVQ